MALRAACSGLANKDYTHTLPCLPHHTIQYHTNRTYLAMPYHTIPHSIILTVPYHTGTRRGHATATVAMEIRGRKSSVTGITDRHRARNSIAQHALDRSLATPPCHNRTTTGTQTALTALRRARWRPRPQARRGRHRRRAGPLVRAAARRWVRAGASSSTVQQRRHLSRAIIHTSSS